MSDLRDVAVDMVNFTVSNVNDAVSFKPHLCREVPGQQYAALKNWYIEFTGTSIRKNKSRLFFLPVNVSDELQQLNPVIPDEVKITSPADSSVVYYKNRLITELDFENVKRVQRACIYIAYAAVNQLLNLETDPALIADTQSPQAAAPAAAAAVAAGASGASSGPASGEPLDPMESCHLSLKRGEVLGFRELGHLISITPWHFHRVFKVITGLTIREYGQLCVEFLKKNANLVNPVRNKVFKLKQAGQSYSCLDDHDFMNDDSVKYECDENCVVLPDYFIDLTKSKESKRTANDTSPPSTASSGSTTASRGRNNAGPAMSLHEQADSSKNQPQHSTSGLSRSEQRKRRSSVMIQKIRAASMCTVSTNPSIQSALNNPGSPIQASVYQSLTPSPSSQNNLTSALVSPNENSQSSTNLCHPSTSTIGLRRKSKASRNGSIAGTEAYGMVTKAQHKRNFSDPVAAVPLGNAANGITNEEYLAHKISLDQSLLENDAHASNGDNTSAAESSLNFPSPQVDFRFTMFDEPTMNMNMDMNLNSLNLSEMALNSINTTSANQNMSDFGGFNDYSTAGMSFQPQDNSANTTNNANSVPETPTAPTTATNTTATATTTDVDLSLPIGDITEMSALSMNPAPQFQYVHAAAKDQQPARNAAAATASITANGVLNWNQHVTSSSTQERMSGSQSLSSTLPTTPQDSSTLLPTEAPDSLLLEFSPEDAGTSSGIDPLYPLYPSTLLTAAPSDAFSTYEDFIAN